MTGVQTCALPIFHWNYAVAFLEMAHVKACRLGEPVIEGVNVGEALAVARAGQDATQQNLLGMRSGPVEPQPLRGFGEEAAVRGGQGVDPFKAAAEGDPLPLIGLGVAVVGGGVLAWYALDAQHREEIRRAHERDRAAAAEAARRALNSLGVPQEQPLVLAAMGAEAPSALRTWAWLGAGALAIAALSR